MEQRSLEGGQREHYRKSAVRGWWLGAKEPRRRAEGALHKVGSKGMVAWSKGALREAEGGLQKFSSEGMVAWSKRALMEGRREQRVCKVSIKRDGNAYNVQSYKWWQHIRSNKYGGTQWWHTRKKEE